MEQLKQVVQEEVQPQCDRLDRVDRQQDDAITDEEADAQALASRLACTALASSGVGGGKEQDSSQEGIAPSDRCAVLYQSPAAGCCRANALADASACAAVTNACDSDEASDEDKEVVLLQLKVQLLQQLLERPEWIHDRFNMPELKHQLKEAGLKALKRFEARFLEQTKAISSRVEQMADNRAARKGRRRR